jgi:hypothetical protein
MIFYIITFNQVKNLCKIKIMEYTFVNVLSFLFTILQGLFFLVFLIIFILAILQFIQEKLNVEIPVVGKYLHPRKMTEARDIKNITNFIKSSLSKFNNFKTTEEVFEVAEAFGKKIEKQKNLHFHSIEILPYPKGKIIAALFILYKHFHDKQDKKMKDITKVNLTICLPLFQEIVKESISFVQDYKDLNKVTTSEDIDKFFKEAVSNNEDSTRQKLHQRYKIETKIMTQILDKYVST